MFIYNYSCHPIRNKYTNGPPHPPSDEHHIYLYDKSAILGYTCGNIIHSLCIIIVIYKLYLTQNS